MTIWQLLEILKEISYKDWMFRVGVMGEGYFLQVRFVEEGEEWGGRKWYVSPHATQGEVVQTALLAVLTAEEHEAREKFLYKGQPIFGPHKRLEELLAAKGEEKREAS